MVQILKFYNIANLSYYDTDKWDNKNVIYKKFDSHILNIVHLYHYYENDELYIAIRGSDSISDIIDDIDIYKVAFKEIDNDLYVHNGFYTDFCEIKNYLEEIIQNKKINSIFFTGHSKGSAICTLSALYIKYKYSDINIYNIGFGCPRIGGSKFANLYNTLLSSTTYLIRMRYDLIPKLPIYDYYDINNQYILENNNISLYKINNNIINNTINIIKSDLKHHELISYKNCDFNL
jgi:hypothetical protein